VSPTGTDCIFHGWSPGDCPICLSDVAMWTELAGLRKEIEQVRKEQREARQALTSARSAIAFDARDWSLDPRDAWLYGLLVGWKGEAMNEVAAKHQWIKDDVDRLQQMHRTIETFFGFKEGERQ
jgi:hypothetical protein